MAQAFAEGRRMNSKKMALVALSSLTKPLKVGKPCYLGSFKERLDNHRFLAHCNGTGQSSSCP